MASLVEIGSVLQQTTVTDASPFTQAYALPAGSETNRVLIVPFMSSLNAGAGPSTGDPADLVATYGGVAMNVLAREVSESITFGVLALHLDGKSFSGSDIVIDVNAGNTVEVTAQPFVFSDVRATDADFSFASAQNHTSLGTTVDLTAITVPKAGDLMFTFAAKRSLQGQLDLNTTGEASYTLEDPNGLGNFQATAVSSGDGGRSAFSVSVSGSQQIQWEQGSSTTIGAVAFIMRTPDPAINCDCTASPQTETLLSLRRRILIRLGFAAQIANPPPGMVSLIDDFLQDAQKQMYEKYEGLHTERFFQWEMTAGTRFYGIKTDDASSSGTCDKLLAPTKLSWVGFKDLNGAWYPLAEGIDPVRYTMLPDTGYPDSYEVRQCIEIFPSPDAAYTLVVKGHFGLLPFAADSDVATIDEHLIFLLALANAKAHYGQPDAGNYLSQAVSYLGDLTSGTHGTRRYIPRTETAPPNVRPILDEFIE